MDGESSDGKVWDLVVLGEAGRDAVAAAERLGARVLFVEENARFVSADALERDGKRHTARAFVLCTGSVTRLPTLTGLDATPYFSPESLPDQLPPSLVVLGADCLGLELADGLRRRGAEITVVESRDRLLPNQDAECVAELRLRLEAGGLRIHTQVTTESVQQIATGIRLLGVRAGARIDLDAAALVATAQRPRVDGLGLDQASVDITDDHIVVDAQLRTSNPRIFAIGSVAGRGRHDLRRDAELAVRNALLPLAARVDDRLTPFGVYTQPAFAWVGLTVAEADAELRDVELFEARSVDGLCRLVTASGRLVGAHLVAAHATLAITTATLAIQQHLPLSSLARLHCPRSSSAQLIQQAAQQRKKRGWLDRVFQMLH